MSLAERLRRALADSERSGEGADFAEELLIEAPLMPAAVLVPVTDRPEPGLLLTLRHANLRRHAGQIAFPGGRIDPEDADAVAAALREANEEIGLDPAAVDVIGASNRYRTGSGFDILPVVGVVPPDLPLVPHEIEVADVFEVPLGHVLDAANHVERAIEHEGRQRRYYEIGWEDRMIWGATAGMIVNLARRLESFA